MYRPLFPTRQQQRNQQLFYKALVAIRPYMILLMLLLGIQHEALGKPISQMVSEPHQESYMELVGGGVSQSREDVMQDVKKEWRERFAIKSHENTDKNYTPKSSVFGFMYVFYAFVGIMFVFALARQLQH